MFFYTEKRGFPAQALAGFPHRRRPDGIFLLAAKHLCLLLEKPVKAWFSSKSMEAVPNLKFWNSLIYLTSGFL
jgi:hypothetical protein